MNIEKRNIKNDLTGGNPHYFIFDNLKFLLIIFVVLGHMAGDYIEYHPSDNASEWLVCSPFKSFFIFVYAFHMPLFLFISGIFQKRESDKFNADSVISYVILGFLLKILIAVSLMLFTSSMDSSYFGLLGQDGVFWYLFVLAGYKGLCYLLRKVKPSLIITLSVMIALFSGYDNELGDWLYLSRFVVFFPFYYVGFCLKPEQILNFCRKVYVRIFSVTALVLWIWICFAKIDVIYPYRGPFTARNPFADVSMSNCEFWNRGIAMIISAVLCIVFISLSTTKKIPMITKFGTRTLQVYFWHKTVIYILINYGMVKKLINKFPNDWWAVYLLLGLVITFVLSFEIFGKPINGVINSVKNREEKK